MGRGWTGGTVGHHASNRPSDHENDAARWRAASIRYFPRLPVVILALALIVDGVGATSPLAAQAGPGIKTTTISGEPTCKRCEIERALLATIHDRTFPGGAFVTGGAVHVNRDGTFLVRAGPRMGELFVADESGAITRQIGRQGEGPGEYFRPLSVHELPQAFVVFDPPLGRVTWFARDNLEVTRTARMPPSVRDGSRCLFRRKLRIERNVAHAERNRLASASGYCGRRRGTLIRPGSAADDHRTFGRQCRMGRPGRSISC